MISWSLKRKVTYIGTILGLIAIILGWWLFVSNYQPSTCFDGDQNGLESGIDCGGACEFLCPFQVSEPVVLFSRAFEVNSGIYNAIAYIENPNFDIGSANVQYTFKFYDDKNNLITERTGTTFVTAGRISPIFEGVIRTDVPISRTFFEFNNDDTWTRVVGLNENSLVVRNKILENADTFPRVKAEIENTSVDELRDIEVVTVVFNAFENAIATSRTFIDVLPRKAVTPIVFTWPQPFGKELEACITPVDVSLLIDTSGSMNNDFLDPPQPLTDAKEAAADFIGRLNEFDRASLATFATESEILGRLTGDHEKTKNLIENVVILPEEEDGSTNLGAGILSSMSILDSSEITNDKTEQIIILLTDGIANAPEEPGGEIYAKELAASAKQKGYTIFTIGLGDEVNSTFLRDVATKPSDEDQQYYYQAASSKDLIGVYESISDSICERGPAIIDIIPRIPNKAEQ